MADEKKVKDVFEDEPVEDAKDKKKKKSKDPEKDALIEENEALKKKVEDLTTLSEDLNNKYLMGLAENKNYKKRVDSEMESYLKYSTFDMCKKLVSILDNFDLALDKKHEDDKINSYLDGFRMTRTQIYKILEDEGVKEIECLGKEFDPNFMVSISHLSDPTKKEQEVVQVFMKGYTYKERVLRPANVIINMIEE